MSILLVHLLGGLGILISEDSVLANDGLLLFAFSHQLLENKLRLCFCLCFFFTQRLARHDSDGIIVAVRVGGGSVVLGGG